MINHLNLVYFLTAAREKNFTKASEKLYITQQALSNHIAVLEKELGVTLFERKQTLRLTYAGEIFYRYALKLVNDYNSMLMEMSDVRQEKKGTLTIGVSHTRGRIILPAILPVFMKKYPGVEVHILEGNTDELTHALKEDEVNLIAGSPDPDTPGMVYEQLRIENVLFCISDKLLERYSENERAAIKKELSERGKIRRLKDIPFLLNKEGNATRIVADEIFKEEGMTPNILIETENIETLGDLCVSAVGAAFCPEALLPTVLGEEAGKNIGVYKLDYPCARIPFAIGYKQDTYMTAALKEMINIIRMFLQQKGCD